ncbi:MAG: hypothetical protein GTO18_02460 [Anaerolineales bacterium]|nr:hypothetical protein [Anaerolineales bacterium]
MENGLQFIKDYLIPGSSTFLVLGLILGVIILYFGKRGRKVGIAWLTVLAVVYWFLSTPLGASGLEAGLSFGYEPLEDSAEVQEAQAIVILGGGSVNLVSRGETMSLLVSESALRAMEGMRLYKMLDEPMVIVSGGSNPFLGGGTPESEMMAELLIDSGIPEEKIIQESSSQNTRDQAQKLEPIMEELGVEKFILVTSPLHIRRSTAVFKAQGLSPIPGPSASLNEVYEETGLGIFPSWIALDASRAAMREFMALGYYWVRGYLSAP